MYLVSTSTNTTFQFPAAEERNGPFFKRGMDLSSMFGDNTICLSGFCAARWSRSVFLE